MTGYAHPEVLVDTQWVADHLHDPQVRLIEVDWRPDTYDAGHIPGAVFWNYTADILGPERRIRTDRGEAEALFARSGIANDTTVVFYSGASSAATGPWALWYLKLFGHRDARVMNGGRKKWAEEGRPLVAERPVVAQTTYHAAEPDPHLRALREWVEQSIGREDRALVDVRTPQEYRGEWFATKPPEGQERAGHIPGAAHIYFEQTLNPDGTFKPAEELHTLYQSQGVSPDKEVITYCTVGGRAGQTWFVLKYLLGYPDVRNYDASWWEWGHRSDTPVEK